MTTRDPSHDERLKAHERLNRELTRLLMQLVLPPPGSPLGLLAGIALYERINEHQLVSKYLPKWVRRQLFTCLDPKSGRPQQVKFTAEGERKDRLAEFEAEVIAALMLRIQELRLPFLTGGYLIAFSRAFAHRRYDCNPRFHSLPEDDGLEQAPSQLDELPPDERAALTELETKLKEFPSQLKGIQLDFFLRLRDIDKVLRWNADLAERLGVPPCTITNRRNRLWERFWKWLALPMEAGSKKRKHKRSAQRQRRRLPDDPIDSLAEVWQLADEAQEEIRALQEMRQQALLPKSDLHPNATPPPVLVCAPTELVSPHQLSCWMDEYESEFRRLWVRSNLLQAETLATAGSKLLAKDCLAGLGELQQGADSDWETLHRAFVETLQRFEDRRHAYRCYYRLAKTAAVADGPGHKLAAGIVEARRCAIPFSKLSASLSAAKLDVIVATILELQAARKRPQRCAAREQPTEPG